MMRGIKLAVLSMVLAVAGAAHAFNITAKSENPALGEPALRAAAQQAAANSGARIPDDPNVKVWVYSHAHPSKIGQNQLIYLHRIQLRRAFNAGAPYPYAGWLPVITVERYGVGDDKEVREELDHVLGEFFTKMKTVDPATGAGIN
jgi:hypothetical protein